MRKLARITQVVLCAVVVSLVAIGHAQTGKGSASAQKVFLRECKLDAKGRGCEDIKIKIRLSGRVVEPLRFTESSGAKGFVVPDEFVGHENLDLIVEAPRGRFTVSRLPASWWRGTWAIGLEHFPFSEEYAYLMKGKPAKCFGYVVYKNTEPETLVHTTDCE